MDFDIPSKLSPLTFDIVSKVYIQGKLFKGVISSAEMFN